MIATIDVKISAQSPNLPLYPWRAYVNSPSALRIRDVPKRVGEWVINAVQVSVVYPDGTTQLKDATLVGGIWLATVPGCTTPGRSASGYTILASGKDESGNAVEGYVLGRGDVEILDVGSTPIPTAPTTYVHLLSAEPSTPHDGDLWQVSGAYYIRQDGTTYPLADVHGDYIIDSDGNRIEADGDFTYLDSNKWSVDCGWYGKYVLSSTSTEEWTYADAEGIQGNNKVVLKWVDYMQGWELKYYQWEETTVEGWSLLASGVTYDSHEATSLEIEITGDFTETAECRKGAPSTDKLATEGYVSGRIGSIDAILDAINGEVI